MNGLLAPLFFGTLIFTAICASSADAQQLPPTSQTCPASTAKVFTNLTTVKAGTEVEFEIQSTDGETTPGEYIWMTSKGTIVSGQGTNRIVVLTNENALDEVMPDPMPTPHPLHGFIGIRRARKPTVPLTITAASIFRDGCSDVQLKTQIAIGNESFSIINNPPKVTELLLDRVEVTSSCLAGFPDMESDFSSESVIDVATEATDPENDVLVFKYTVTAGRIIGHGSKVKWDLSGVKPGTYEITASADDGCGFCGKTITKTVTVTRCF
jgi:hypothetical protein